MARDAATKSDNPWRQRFDTMLSNDGFDAIMGLIILANAVVIGFEIDFRAKQEPTPLWVSNMEVVFLFIYTTEIGLRYFTYRIYMQIA